jgi:anti-sigma-K factor RskA
MNDLKNQERMLDLLTEQALGGLSAENQRELDALLEKFPEWKDDETLALTAAAINLSIADPSEEMPAHLKSKIIAGSENYFASRENHGKVLDFKAKTEPEKIARNETAGNFSERASKTSFWNWAGWAVAAAACVLLGINLWMTRTFEPTEIVRTPPAASPTPTPGFAEQRQQLLAAAPDAVQSSWTDIDPKKPRKVVGDVVWSNALQKGYLRFQNLPVNDKTKETYQLWIFDENQSAETPIDGGVFDVDENGDVIVPIDPKIKVQKPTMFAVTAEKPGGVVVSKREKVMAIAKIET